MGTTQSPDFPTTAGAFKRTGATSNSLEVFVTKLNPTGTALVYSTFIGGSNFDWGRAIAIDAAGNAYVTGQTKSSDFPTTAGAFDRTFNVDTCPRCGIDQEDAFVLKLNAAGSALVYSTFIGGFDLDDGLGIAVDAAGNAYVTGVTVMYQPMQLLLITGILTIRIPEQMTHQVLPIQHMLFRLKELTQFQK